MYTFKCEAISVLHNIKFNSEYCIKMEKTQVDGCYICFSVSHVDLEGFDCGRGPITIGQEGVSAV